MRICICICICIYASSVACVARWAGEIGVVCFAVVSEAEEGEEGDGDGDGDGDGEEEEKVRSRASTQLSRSQSVVGAGTGGEVGAVRDGDGKVFHLLPSYARVGRSLCSSLGGRRMPDAMCALGRSE
ncbi:hypothetical protein EVG20_g5192 [Dentipellis fragilis]|uniref:Secreted protein n=1 Tax=Dentipellis fragilis TaxID=205917 RepID=A0A4Y9YTL2_9AGAM|nr:hypothetical protein EVG20_g5192 [Dentipellis fragilis]